MPLSVKVNSSKVSYGEDFIRAKYNYESSTVEQQAGGKIIVSKLLFFLRHA